MHVTSFLYCSCISPGVARRFIITLSVLRMLRKANIKGLRESAGVWLAARQAGAEQAWTPEALASVPQRKQWCQNFWTHCSIIPLWGSRGAESSAEIWRWRCDHKSEVPHTLSLLTNFSLSPTLSPSDSLSQRRHILNPLAIGLPAVHQQKTINCFIGWSFCKVMSSALRIPGILLA